MSDPIALDIVSIRSDPVTNVQLRELTRETVSNGFYATQICRGCGRVVSEPSGYWADAVIVAICKKCFVPVPLED